MFCWIFLRFTSFSSSKEKVQISGKLDRYNYLVSYWRSMIATYNIKIYFTWFFGTSDHIPIKDAFCSSGGIFVIWPQSFHGLVAISSVCSADIIFHYSKMTAQIDKTIQQDYKYIIISGYPKDYTPNLLKSHAKKVRKRLQKNGAKIIITVFDENSGPDSRWHTGHELQRENYYNLYGRLWTFKKKHHYDPVYDIKNDPEDP